LIFTIAFIAGLVLLILPGFYIAIRLQFYYASIIEEDTGIISSLKRSWEITKGQETRLLILLLVEIALILLGLICFVIGIFITAPYVGMMNCYDFRKLTAFTTEEINI
jgi:membrane-anchored glycerophosphoryl diester phosphodiesterase (GDPDase)